MTTVGVATNPRPPVMPASRNMLSYNYPVPRREVRVVERIQGCSPQLGFQSVNRLEEVKREPCDRTRSSGRQITEFSEMYTAPYQSLQFSRRDQPRSVTSLPLHQIRCKIMREKSAPVLLNNTSMDWSRFLDKCPERYLFSMNSTPEYLMNKYEMRYLRPDITKHWKYYQEPDSKLSKYIFRPKDTTVNADYRTEDLRYGSPISSLAWRP